MASSAVGPRTVGVPSRGNASVALWELTGTPPGVSGRTGRIGTSSGGSVRTGTAGTVSGRGVRPGPFDTASGESVRSLGAWSEWSVYS